MTENQINAFYKEIGNLVSKHNLGGIAGLWISPKGEDNTFAVFDPADQLNSRFLKHIVERLNSILMDAGYKKAKFTSGFTDPDNN